MRNRADIADRSKPRPTFGAWGSLVVPASLGSREIVGSNPTAPTTTRTTDA